MEGKVRVHELGFLHVIPHDTLLFLSLCAIMGSFWKQPASKQCQCHTVQYSIQRFYLKIGGYVLRRCSLVLEYSCFTRCCANAPMLSFGFHYFSVHYLFWVFYEPTVKNEMTQVWSSACERIRNELHTLRQTSQCPAFVVRALLCRLHQPALKVEW